MKFTTELLKGTNSLLVLSVLEKEEMYGYIIVRTIAGLSEDYFQMNEGTLYPILHSLEKEGYLTSSWKTITDGGRKRRYYKITDKGLKCLASYKKEWKEHSSAVSKVLGGAVHVGT